MSAPALRETSLLADAGFERIKQYPGEEQVQLKVVLPLYYKAYVSEVGSQKAASANVETVFSGVGGMVQKATTIGSDLVTDCAICHHN